MRTISLKPSGETLVDDADYEMLSKYSWCLTNGYASRISRINGKRTNVRMHRVIMGVTGKNQVGHIDGNRLNNQRSNLRLATSSQSHQNYPLRSDNSTGFKGVFYAPHAKRYRARITLYGKAIYLGYFDDPAIAHEAYCRKAKELFGEFANDGNGPIG